MTRFSARRKVAVLLLGMVLVASWASALEPRDRPTPRTHRPLTLEGLLDHLREIFSGIWIKNGCSPDPDGGPKVGASLDPNGATSRLTSDDDSDAGASLDPDG